MCRRVIDGSGDQKVQVRVQPQKNAECRHSRLILWAHVWLAGASGPGGRDRRRAAAKGGGAPRAAATGWSTRKGEERLGPGSRTIPRLLSRDGRTPVAARVAAGHFTPDLVKLNSASYFDVFRAHGMDAGVGWIEVERTPKSLN